MMVFILYKVRGAFYQILRPREGPWFESVVCLFGNDDSDAVFLLISPVDTRCLELVFALHERPDDFIKVAVKIRARHLFPSTWTLNKVKSQRLLSLESPNGRAITELQLKARQV